MKQFKYNKKQTATIDAHNARIDAEKICAADDIGNECVCDECINNMCAGYL